MSEVEGPPYTQSFVQDNDPDAFESDVDAPPAGQNLPHNGDGRQVVAVFTTTPVSVQANVLAHEFDLLPSLAAILRDVLEEAPNAGPARDLVRHVLQDCPSAQVWTGSHHRTTPRLWAEQRSMGPSVPSLTAVLLVMPPGSATTPLLSLRKSAPLSQHASRFPTLPASPYTSYSFNTSCFATRLGLVHRHSTLWKQRIQAQPRAQQPAQPSTQRLAAPLAPAQPSTQRLAPTLAPAQPSTLRLAAPLAPAAAVALDDNTTAHETPEFLLQAIRSAFPQAALDIARCLPFSMPPNQRGRRRRNPFAAEYGTTYASWRIYAHIQRCCEAMSLDVREPSRSRMVSFPSQTCQVCCWDVLRAFDIPASTWNSAKTRFSGLHSAAARLQAAATDEARRLFHRLSFFLQDVSRVDPLANPARFVNEEAIWEWAMPTFFQINELIHLYLELLSPTSTAANESLIRAGAVQGNPMQFLLVHHPLWDPHTNSVTLYDGIRKDGSRRIYLSDKQLQVVLLAAVSQGTHPVAAPSSSPLSATGPENTTTLTRADGCPRDDPAYSTQTAAPSIAVPPSPSGVYVPIPFDADETLQRPASDTGCWKDLLVVDKIRLLSSELHECAVGGDHNRDLQSFPTAHDFHSSEELALVEEVVIPAYLLIPDICSCTPQINSKQTARARREKRKAKGRARSAAKPRAQSDILATYFRRYTFEQARHLWEFARQSFLNSTGTWLCLDVEATKSRELTENNDNGPDNVTAAADTSCSLPPFLYGTSRNMPMVAFQSAFRSRLTEAVLSGPLFIVCHDQFLERFILGQTLHLLPGDHKKDGRITLDAATGNFVCYLDTQALFFAMSDTNASVRRQVSLIKMARVLSVDATVQGWHNAGNDAKWTLDSLERSVVRLKWMVCLLERSFVANAAVSLPSPTSMDVAPQGTPNNPLYDTPTERHNMALNARPLPDGLPWRHEAFKWPELWGRKTVERWVRAFVADVPTDEHGDIIGFLLAAVVASMPDRQPLLPGDLKWACERLASLRDSSLDYSAPPDVHSQAAAFYFPSWPHDVLAPERTARAQATYRRDVLAYELVRAVELTMEHFLVQANVDTAAVALAHRLTRLALHLLAKGDDTLQTELMFGSVSAIWRMSVGCSSAATPWLLAYNLSLRICLLDLPTAVKDVVDSLEREEAQRVQVATIQVLVEHLLRSRVDTDYSVRTFGPHFIRNHPSNIYQGIIMSVSQAFASFLERSGGRLYIQAPNSSQRLLASVMMFVRAVLVTSGCSFEDLGLGELVGNILGHFGPAESFSTNISFHTYHELHEPLRLMASALLLAPGAKANEIHTVAATTILDSFLVRRCSPTYARPGWAMTCEGILAVCAAIESNVTPFCSHLAAHVLPILDGVEHSLKQAVEAGTADVLPTEQIGLEYHHHAWVWHDEPSPSISCPARPERLWRTDCMHWVAKPTAVILAKERLLYGKRAAQAIAGDTRNQQSFPPTMALPPDQSASQGGNSWFSEAARFFTLPGRSGDATEPQSEVSSRADTRLERDGDDDASERYLPGYLPESTPVVTRPSSKPKRSRRSTVGDALTVPSSAVPPASPVFSAQSPPASAHTAGDGAHRTLGADVSNRALSFRVISHAWPLCDDDPDDQHGFVGGAYQHRVADTFVRRSLVSPVRVVSDDDEQHTLVGDAFQHLVLSVCRSAPASPLCDDDDDDEQHALVGDAFQYLVLNFCRSAPASPLCDDDPDDQHALVGGAYQHCVADSFVRTSLVSPVRVVSDPDDQHALVGGADQHCVTDSFVRRSPASPGRVDVHKQHRLVGDAYQHSAADTFIRRSFARSSVPLPMSASSTVDLVEQPTAAPEGTGDSGAQPAAVQRVPIDLAAVQASDRASATATIRRAFLRLDAACPQGAHLTSGELEVVMGNFQDRQTRLELADLAARDRFEDVSSAQIVHPWFVRQTNTRHAAAHHLRQDIINAVEPETMEGTRFLDANTEPALETYFARAIRNRSGTYEETYRVMLEAFRHGIAVWHVADFTARKEHVMQSARYRNRDTINVLNARPPCDFVAIAENPAAQVVQTEAFARYEARRRWHDQMPGLPQLPTFDTAVRDVARLRGPRALAIRSVILDMEPSCVGLEDWPRIFRETYRLVPRVVAQLVQAALTDVLAANWPV
ncbi:hypothetical protein AURDEDRAFT_121749 [Auricularia subglabra TFB-10046 SS5]|nr:hypothetical protein AURDEDRAFT_121749 [Auricularia subglabra TFB-10046 SS5]